MTWRYSVPLMCFLLRGNAAPLSGTVQAPSRSEARSRLKKLFGFNRVPENTVLEKVVVPWVDPPEPGVPR